VYGAAESKPIEELYPGKTRTENEVRWYGGTNVARPELDHGKTGLTELTREFLSQEGGLASKSSVRREIKQSRRFFD